MVLESEQTWHLATLWVKSNRMLINCISAHYYPYMGCSSKDLEGEALLVAYQVLSGLVHQERDLSLMARYFTVVFRSRCIHMTMGIVPVQYDVERLRVVQEEQPVQQELDQQMIEEALQLLTNRQRQVAQWILQQPTPATVTVVARHFDITGRAVRRLLSNAIYRIENGPRRVCSHIPSLP